MSPPNLAHRSAIVSFAVPGDVRAACTRLREAYIGLSPHGYNEEEVPRVGEVLGES